MFFLSTVNADENPMDVDPFPNSGILFSLLMIEVIIVFLFITWNFMGLLLGIITDIIGIPLLIIIVGSIMNSIGDTTAFILFNLLLLIRYFLG